MEELKKYNFDRAKACFAKYYEAAMNWIGDNTGDVNTYTIRFPELSDTDVEGQSKVYFTISIYTNNGYCACLFGKIRLNNNDRNLYKNIYYDLYLNYNSWEENNRIMEDYKARVDEYVEMLNKINSYEMIKEVEED